MIDIVDPRTGELLDTDSVPGLAEVAGLHDEQIRRLGAQLAQLEEGGASGGVGAGGATSWSWRDAGAHGAETLWHQLAEWVGWLRGRYPLARQLPLCWWRHPELVEELTALWLAWREGYVEKNAPMTAPAEWHARWLPDFLRRIGAGGWNVACDGGHKDRVDGLYDNRAVDDAEAFAEHVNADADRRRGGGDPAARRRTRDEETHVYSAISDDRMRALVDAGEARLIGGLSGSPIAYADAYWSPGEDGWVRVEDPETVDFMRTAEARLALADEAVERGKDAT